MATPQRRTWAQVLASTRDTLSLGLGLAGIYHETWMTNLDRPYLLALFGGMIGAPAFIRADQKRQQKRRTGQQRPKGD